MELTQTKTRLWTKLWQPALVALCGAFCLAADWFLLFKRSFWVDEFITVRTVSQPVGQMIATTLQDVHPPLYYLIVQGLLAVCPNVELAYRLSGFLPLMLLVLAALWFSRTLGAFPPILLLIYAFFSEHGLDHAAEARMYGWLLLFVTLFGFALYRIVAGVGQEKHNYILLTVAGLLTAYTQYFSLITVAILYLYLLVELLLRRRALRPWLVCVGVSVAAYLPWLLPYLRYVGNSTTNFALNDPSSWQSSLEQLFGEDERAYLLVGLMVVVAAIYLLCAVRLGWQPGHSLLLAAAVGLLGTIAVGEAMSALIRPVWVARYGFSACGLCWLAFGVALNGLLRPRGLRLAGQAAVLLLAVWCCQPIYQQKKENVAASNQWIADSIAYVQSLAQPGDHMAADAGLHISEIVLEFYLPEQDVQLFEEPGRWLDGQHCAFLCTRKGEDGQLDEDTLQAIADARMYVKESREVYLAASFGTMYYIVPNGQ